MAGAAAEPVATACWARRLDKLQAMVLGLHLLVADLNIQHVQQPAASDWIPHRYTSLDLRLPPRLLLSAGAAPTALDLPKKLLYTRLFDLDRFFHSEHMDREDSGFWHFLLSHGVYLCGRRIWSAMLFSLSCTRCCATRGSGHYYTTTTTLHYIPLTRPISLLYCVPIFILFTSHSTRTAFAFAYAAQTRRLSCIFSHL